MTWEEAVKYCEDHECEDCIAYIKNIEKRSKEEQENHVPCCINLVTESDI